MEKVEILPFHKIGEYKWEQIGYEYQLKNPESPTPEQVESVMNTFGKYGLKVQ